MTTWSFYDAQTGMFVGRVFTGPDLLLPLNTPDGSLPITGIHDHLSQRVELESGKVVDYQPPAADADHEWIHDNQNGDRVRRWVLKPEAVQRQAQRGAALARIAELERKQERALREHILGIVPTDDERDAGAMTLQEIQDEIAALRSEVNGG